MWNHFAPHKMAARPDTYRHTGQPRRGTASGTNTPTDKTYCSKMYPHATKAYCCHACISDTYWKGVGDKVFIPYKFFFRKINLDTKTTASCARHQRELLGSRNVHPMALQTSASTFFA